MFDVTQRKIWIAEPQMIVILILIFSRMTNQESTIVMVRLNVYQMIYYFKYIYIIEIYKPTHVKCSRCAV